DTRAGADDAAGREGRDATIATIRSEGTAGPNTGMLGKLFAEATTAEVRERVAAMMAQATPEAMIAALGAMRDRPDRHGVLSGLTGIPTLIVVGSEDRITPPEMSRQMADAAAGAELVEVEGAGHLAPMERPATVNEALQRFLDRVV
ncbi:MAG TPA: alpha/beta fold hydrolase, partial [Gemmatimonadales bacterium]|nr:alpha/beta fold hydrolase [Gemmatimonadales bacterium]